MQGRLILFSILVAGLTPVAALAAETVKRQPCPKEQAQQTQQRKQQQRPRPQGCQIQRTVPPVVDPTPIFLL